VRGDHDALLATVGVEELQGCRNRFLICGHQATDRAHSDAPAAALAPNPVVDLNRTVAVAEVEGPHAAPTLVDRLELGDCHLYQAIRADLLRRLGRHAEAALAYEAAIGRSENAAEREFLQRRRRTPAQA